MREASDTPPADPEEDDEAPDEDPDGDEDGEDRDGAAPEADEPGEPVGPGWLVRLGGWVQAVVVVDGVVIAADGAALVGFDGRTGAPCRRRELPATALLACEGRLFVGTDDGAVHLVDPATFATIAVIKIPDCGIVSLAIDGDRLVAGASAIDSLIVLDAATLARRATWPAGYGLPLGLLARDGWIGVGDEQATYRLVDAATGAVRACRQIGDSRGIQVQAAALAPDGRTIAVLTECGGGELVEVATLTPVAALPGGWACAWSAEDGLRIAELEEVHIIGAGGGIVATRRSHPAARGNVTTFADDRASGVIAVGHEYGALWIVDRALAGW